jgi:hypothetical protein
LSAVITPVAVPPAVGGPDTLDVGMALVKRFKDCLRRVPHEIAVHLSGDDDFRMRLERVFETLAPINGHRRSCRTVDDADDLLAVGVRGHGGEQRFRHLTPCVLVAWTHERFIVREAFGLRREVRIAIGEDDRDVGLLGETQTPGGGRPIGREDDAVVLTGRRDPPAT